MCSIARLSDRPGLPASKVQKLVPILKPDPFSYPQDGDKRYNCVDCTQSYDLCHKCYVSGQAKSHTSKKGPHHTFVKDTQSHTFASTLVHKAKTLEELILNMFK